MVILRQSKFGISVNDEASGPCMGLSRLRIKIRRQYKHCTGGEGGGPQILSAFVKQRTYQPLPAASPLIPGFQDLQQDFLDGSAKFGPASMGVLW
jgi:hypothetical protein